MCVILLNFYITLCTMLGLIIACPKNRDYPLHIYLDPLHQAFLIFGVLRPSIEQIITFSTIPTAKYNHAQTISKHQ